jgi:type IX secretion system PorP/SprF family membrane protein
LALRQILLYIIFISLQPLLAQEIGAPNLSGVTFKENMSFLNPAAISIISKKGNIFFGHKQGVGAFSVFRQNYFNANYLLGNDSVPTHGLGIRVISDNAGKYIGVNRVSFLYSYSLALDEKKRLCVGIAPTVMNYRKKANNFGGNANIVNVDLGVWLHSKNYDFGLSLNQIIPNEFVLIDEVNLIRQQFVFIGKYKIEINREFSLGFVGIYTLNTLLENEEILGLSISYLKRFRASLNQEFNKSLTMTLGIEGIKISPKKGTVNIDFGFSMPTNKQLDNKKSEFELLLNYQL